MAHDEMDTTHHGATAPAHPADCDCDDCKPDGYTGTGQTGTGHASMNHMDMTRDMMLTPRLHNHPHQHACTLIGHQTVFAVHMTQFYMEEHKYQLVFELGLPPDIAAALDKARRRSPRDWFVLSNHDSDLFSIPEVASGRRTSYRAQIFQGLPDFTDKDEDNPHFYPWSPDRVIPLLPAAPALSFTASVRRIVTFRPFAHHLPLPDVATYLLFGKGQEAHMTNLQNSRLATSRFDGLGFGPDYDHVMSLQSRPDGLEDAQLEAGIVVSVPAIRLRKRRNGRQCVPGAVPIRAGDRMALLYRGIQPEITAIAGESFLFGTAVCSSPQTLHADQTCLLVSKTPDTLQKHKKKI